MENIHVFIQYIRKTRCKMFNKQKGNERTVTSWLAKSRQTT